MSQSPIGAELVPHCCTDAGGGEMVQTRQGWLCVWCGREADRLECIRQLSPPAAASAAVPARQRLAPVAPPNNPPPPPQREVFDVRPPPTRIPSDGRPYKG